MNCISKIITLFLVVSGTLFSQEKKYNLVDLGETRESISSSGSSIGHLGHITGNIELTQSFQWYDQAYLWENSTLDTIPKLPHPDYEV